MICFVCSKKVVSLSHMQAHVRLQHNLNLLDEYICQQEHCIRSFSHVQALYNHIRKCHINSNAINLTNNCNNDKPAVSNISGDSFVCNNLLNTVEDDSTTGTVSDSNSDDQLEVIPSAVKHIADFSARSSSALPNQHFSSVDNKTAELSFILKLFKKLNLNRKDVEDIIHETKVLIECKFPNSGEHFEGLTSEYLIKKELIKRELYSEPESIILDISDTSKISESDHVLTKKSVIAAYTPLSVSIKLIFDNATLLALALDYMKEKNSPEELKDLKDGTKFSDLGKNVLPFVVYYDEVECGNPLESHKSVNKIGAIYFAFRCLPPHLYSLLGNIYVYALFPVSKSSYINKVIENLVTEISFLCKEGLIIKGNKIHFIFAGVLGDNLAVHQFLGFSPSFVANYWCRDCKIFRDDARVATLEDPSLLRTKENYIEDLEKEFSESGLAEESALNSIPGYHVTDNCFVDCMHDVAEGVARFGIFSVIEYYVENKLLSLDIINSRIRFFPFLNKCNKPPIITQAQMRKGDLAYSASETINLVLFFGLMIGDLIEAECAVWLYYTVLRTLVDTLLLKTLSVSHVPYLTNLIHEHHTMYKSVFNKLLRPKHHILTHYPRCLEKTGPFTHNWGMRFESKHVLLKLVANVMKCRINMPKSILTRLQFLSSYNLLSMKYNSVLKNIYDVGSIATNSGYRWIIYKGIKYTVSNFICVGNDDRNVNPKFGSITSIFVNNEFVNITVEVYETLYLDSHMTAYAIKNYFFTCFSN